MARKEAAMPTTKAIIKMALRQAYLRGYDSANGKGCRTDAEQSAWDDKREEAVNQILRDRMGYRSSSVTTKG